RPCRGVEFVLSRVERERVRAIGAAERTAMGQLGEESKRLVHSFGARYATGWLFQCSSWPLSLFDGSASVTAGGISEPFPTNQMPTNDVAVVVWIGYDGATGGHVAVPIFEPVIEAA